MTDRNEHTTVASLGTGDYVVTVLRPGLPISFLVPWWAAAVRPDSDRYEDEN